MNDWKEWAMDVIDMVKLMNQKFTFFIRLSEQAASLLMYTVCSQFKRNLLKTCDTQFIFWFHGHFVISSGWVFVIVMIWLPDCEHLFHNCTYLRIFPTTYLAQTRLYAFYFRSNNPKQWSTPTYKNSNYKQQDQIKD